MSIRHHPDDTLVTAFAAGTLDQGQHVVTATHIARCSRCRARVTAFEHVGGEMLEALPPAALSSDALARIEARLDRPALPPPEVAEGLADVPGLPSFVRRLSADGWSWLAPGLQVRRLHLGPASLTRVFLLKSRPGAKFLRHTHTGFEMTCVLTGSFSHGGQRYAEGDFDLGTPEVEHRIEIGAEGPCVSIVAMQGELKLPGLFGRLLQPLIRL